MEGAAVARPFFRRGTASNRSETYERAALSPIADVSRRLLLLLSALLSVAVN